MLVLSQTVADPGVEIGGHARTWAILNQVVGPLGPTKASAMNGRALLEPRATHPKCKKRRRAYIAGKREKSENRTDRQTDGVTDRSQHRLPLYHRAGASLCIS